MSAPRILAVNGSLRDESYTRTALKHALVAAEAAGAETAMLDLAEYDLPVFDPDRDEPGDSAAVVRTVREADGLLLGSPVYHGSYSAAFRNLHDYCSFDEYEDTVVGLLATAGGGSYGSTLDHMRGTVRGVHGHVIPQQVGIRNASDKFEADSAAPDGRRFADADLADRVDDWAETVVETARLYMGEDERAVPCADD